MPITIFHVAPTTDNLGNTAQPEDADVLLIEGVSIELLSLVARGIYAQVWSFCAGIGFYVPPRALRIYIEEATPLDRRLVVDDPNLLSSHIDRIENLQRTLRSEPDSSLHDLKTVAGQIGCPRLRAHTDRVYDFIDLLASMGLLTHALDSLDTTIASTLAELQQIIAARPPEPPLSVCDFLSVLRSTPSRSLRLIDRLAIDRATKDKIRYSILRGEVAKVITLLEERL